MTTVTALGDFFRSVTLRWITLAALGLSGCAMTDDAPDPDATATALAASAWRLLQIRSAGGELRSPDDRDAYTLAFGDDGRATVRSDCNRGQGDWSVTPPRGLQIGPLATTRALCPPDSLDERFIGGLNAVRSYSLQDGRLLLTTTPADGTTLEFEPAAR